MNTESLRRFSLTFTSRKHEKDPFSRFQRLLFDLRGCRVLGAGGHYRIVVSLGVVNAREVTAEDIRLHVGDLVRRLTPDFTLLSVTGP